MFAGNNIYITFAASNIKRATTLWYAGLHLPQPPATVPAGANVGKKSSNNKKNWWQQ